LGSVVRLRCYSGLLLAGCLFGLMLASSTAAAEETVYAAVDGAIVYQSGTDSSPEIASLSAGTPLLSHGGRGEWLSVDVVGSDPKVSGWIKKDLVSATSPE